MSNPYLPPSTNFSSTSEQDGGWEPSFFSLSARIGRLRYLAYVLAILVVSAFPLMIAVMFNFGMLFPPLILLTLLVAALAAVIPSIRRLHDLGYSGWLAILAVVPLANCALGVWLTLAKGTEGPNRFGASPGANTAGVVVAAIGMLITVLLTFTFFRGWGDERDFTRPPPPSTQNPPSP
ncbi:MAG: DUF805 domain-containing protein [Massilia sp.]